ncbi:EAL domain-containing protein [Pseudoalteromonas sp.]|uniref:EAL domain-containing protein n=1 Tax=Pseudoalteromonas sp. TaxID=53249 RepID=UPI001BCFBED0|nr:EAL domain-containing protein [Pseudoalteromonas sp.]
MINIKNKHHIKNIRLSVFFSSILLLISGVIFFIFDKLFVVTNNTYGVIFSLNTAVLIFLTTVLLIAITQKSHLTIKASLSAIIVLLLFSSSFTPVHLNFIDSMPWQQSACWSLVLVGCICKLRKESGIYNKISLICFVFLSGGLLVSLSPIDIGWLGKEFSTSLSVTNNIKFFLLFVTFAGITVSPSLNLDLKKYFSEPLAWLATLITIITMLLWFSFMYQLESGNQKVVQKTIVKFQNQTEQLLNRHNELIARLAERFELSNMTQQPGDFLLDSGTYIRDFNYLDYIGVLDAQGRIYSSSSKNIFTQQWYDNYLTKNFSSLSKNIITHKDTGTVFYYNNQIDHTFIVVPLAHSEKPELLGIITVIDIKSVMESIIPLITPKGYFLEFGYKNRPEAMINQLDSKVNYYLVSEHHLTSLNSINWKLRVYQSPEHEGSYLILSSSITFIAGWLVCVLLLLSQQYQMQIKKQRQRLSRKNEKLLSSLALQKRLQTQHVQFMENSADILCVVDNNGKFLEVSKSSLNILGYESCELKNKPFMDFVHPDDKSITSDEVKKLFSGSATQYFRNTYIHKQGHKIHLMWSAKYIQSTNTLYAVARNITELVSVERYQSAQQEVLKLIALEKPLHEILHKICLMAEEHSPCVKACAMTKTDNKLKLAAAPSLGRQYHTSFSSIKLTSPAGFATHSNRTVICDNTEISPLWLDYKHLLLNEKLFASWSKSILIRGNEVLGTLTFFCNERRSPSSEEEQLLTNCCRLAANAIERSQQKYLLMQSEQRFKSLYQFNPEPVYVLDEQGYFKSVNEPGCNLLGWPLSDLVKMHFSQVILSQRLTEVSAFFANALKGEATSFETSIINKAGEQHELHVVIIPTWIDGQITGVIGIAKNITQSLYTEKQLRLFKRAVDASSNGIVITDITQPDMPICYVNSGFENITGYNTVEVTGNNCRFLQGKERDELACEQIRSAIKEKRELNIILKNYRKDGSAFWNSLFLSPVPDESGIITHYIGIQKDITEQKKYEQELAYNTSHDLLTGLPNRSLLLDRLSQSINISSRHKERVAILLIDLDHFHLVNDNLGHLIGDEVIRQMTIRIKDKVRVGDTLARMEGDEFILLLPDVKNEAELTKVIKKLLNMISMPFEVDGHKVQISASIGVSISDDLLKEATALIRQADLAMYEAKQQGRNNAQWYNVSMEDKFNKRLDLRGMLKKALANHEFELYYQPQVEAGSGRLIGLEALLRWKHPKLGMIGPDEFIPIAEEMGLIAEIGQWVLKKAMLYNYSLQKRGLAKIVMAVNLSSLQFQREDFVQQLKIAISESKLAPKWLELELTESLLFENIDQVVQKLQEIKQLGVSIAIDDFGTGFSSLNYLKRLPIDRIKIDKSFTRELVTDHKDGAIIRAIIAMSHQLGLKVIAEGVETTSQATLLHKMLCDELQGYLFAKPLPIELLEIFIEEYLPNSDTQTHNDLPTLLLVDDEENILYSLQRVLRKQPYKVFTCKSAVEAFELLASNDVQVVLSDQRMPQMNGTEFLSRVKDMYPDTVRLVLSGYTDLRTVTDAINHGSIYKFITKPWQDEELKKELKSAFNLYKQRVNKSD